MAKGVGLIAVVGGLAGGQANLRGVLSGLVVMIALFMTAYWLEGRALMLEGWTLFDQTMFFLAVVSVILATVTYFYTHPRKKQ